MPDRPERPRLLLIDDKPAELRELSAVLRDDFDLIHATDGQAGFHRAQAQRPDLILLDAAMPGTDGLAVCRLLQSDAATRAIPVIFLSGLNQPEQRLSGFELGAVDYIGKPFHAAEVRARVLVHLRHLRRNAAPPADAGAAGDTADAVTAATPAAVPAAAVQAAMLYIARHLAELPTVSQIAQQVGLSEQRLLALFREQLGLTVSGFVAEERVRAGSRLLAQTQMSVQEVAFEVGFRSPGNFISAFKDRLGMTPKAWRQAVLEGRVAAPAGPAA